MTTKDRPLSRTDATQISRKIRRFISNYVSKSSARGLVMGLSGGLDSSVVSKLCVNAIGPTKVLGLIMPSNTTPKDDIQHAIDLAEDLKMRYLVIDINPIIGKYEEALPGDKRARGNLMARIRMNLLYYHAGVNQYLVAGTSDKSEIQIGYFTKFGDGAADILPIGALYKTEVRKLAVHLQIPTKIVEKKSSPRLWNNHLAEEEIGMDYEIIDAILHLIEKKTSSITIANRLGISAKNVKRIEEMMLKSTHKRRPPTIAPI